MGFQKPTGRYSAPVGPPREKVDTFPLALSVCVACGDGGGPEGVI